MRNSGIELIVGLSLLGIACSTTTTDHPDYDDAGVTAAQDGGTSPGSTPDASTGQDASTSKDGGGVTVTTNNTCPIMDNDPTCEACFASSCASQCGACNADTACDAALRCIASCSDAACREVCVSGLTTAQGDLVGAIFSDNGCFASDCATACGVTTTPTAKNGDPCTTNAQCVSNFCSGSWCEPATQCTKNTDCGVDSEGELVWCIPTALSVNGCFPGCSTSEDCVLYPGTTCKEGTATNGATAFVCAD